MSEPKTAYDRVVAAQKQAALPEASIWVSANAGSGKTKVLIDRVARLLLTGVQPDSILCITYTKAAASEMQQRLFKRLGAWSVMGNDELARDLKDLQGMDYSGDGEALKAARALFAKALETPGGLRIETLHAFAGRVLRRFPLEARVPPGFKELDEVDNKALWTKAARKSFDKLKASPHRWPLFTDLMKEIGGKRYDGAIEVITGSASKLHRFLHGARTPERRFEAISTTLSAPLVSASEVLRELMDTGLPRQELTAAINELRTLGGKKDANFSDQLLSVMDVADLKAAMDTYRKAFYDSKGNLRETPPYTKKLEGTIVEDLFAPGTGREVDRFLRLENDVKAALLRDRTVTLVEIAVDVMAEHDHEKRIRAGLDFDDLIANTRDLLTGPGLAEWVLYKLDGGISHVLLDEAQDTSPDQWVIVNSLVEEFFSGASGHDLIRTLFVVGDEKQSIYSFQGADTVKFQSERQRFASRQTDDTIGGKIHLPQVEMSFRSTQQVLSFVDEVFNGPASFGSAPFSTAPPSEADKISHQAFREPHRGLVEFWPLDEPEAVPTGAPWHAPMDMERQVSAPAQLAAKLANWIDARLSPGAPAVYEEGKDGKPRPARPGDILILVRSRKALFHSIIQQLKAKGLPVAGADRLNLQDTLAVQDVLNLVRFALLQEDDLTLAEILKGPFLGLLDDDTHLFPLAYDRGQSSLWQRLQESGHGDHKRAAAFLKTVLERRRLPAFEFLSWVMNTRHADLSQTGWQMINARFGSPAHDPLEALISISANLEDAESASLQTFLAAVEAQDSEIKREQSGPADEIRVMTVHGSKGLEAPIVILPDTTGIGNNTLSGNLSFTEDGVPVWMVKKDEDCAASAAIRALEEAKSRAEANRLLYVALTRAKDQLLICGAWNGAKNGQGYKDGSWYDLCQQTIATWALGDAERDDDGIWRFGGLPQPESDTPVVREEKPVAPLPDWIFKPRPVSTSEHQDQLRAPSSLLPGDTPVLPPFGKDHVRRFQRGRLIHALLEILPDTPYEDRRARASRFIDTCLDADQAHLKDDIIDVTFSVLEAPELAPVFGPGGRPEAPVVGRGPNIPKGVIINGRVDRLRVTEDEVWVIDYKTDRPPPKRAEDVAMPYLAQLGAYKDVLSVTYPDKCVKCALLWTDGPHFMVLDESAMLAALVKAKETD